MSKVTDRYGCRVCARRYHYNGKMIPDLPPGDVLVTFTRSGLPGLHLWMVQRNGWYTAGATWGKNRAVEAAGQAGRHLLGLCVPPHLTEVVADAAG